ncbi:MAG: hypothetical protein NTAFB05_01880 [Nitrobacter sp.]
MTIAESGNPLQPERPTLSSLAWVAALIAAMTVLRCIFAATLDLRTDEAYYWTWSKESALSFLDHPPMIAWFIRLGTAIFGDTNFGVRFAGLLAMPISQLLLADIVRRVTRDIRAAVLAVLMMEAALYYGLLMAKVAPDVALIPFELAMVWSLVRLTESGDARWWLAAGFFGGLALLSKLTALMLVPAVVLFIVVPDWRSRWLRSPYLWAAPLIAAAVFSPVLIWNWMHDWASFRFQFVRATAAHGVTLRTLGDYLGLQFGQVGPILLPVVLVGVAVTAWRGFRHRDPVSVLLSAAVLVPFGYFLWKSLTLRVGDTWPMFIWPLGFAATAIDIAKRSREKWPAWIARSSAFWVNAAIASGLVLVVAVFLYYRRQPLEFHRQDRSDRRRSRLRAGREPRRKRIAGRRGDMDRDRRLPDLCDAALASEGSRAGDPDQRTQPLHGFPRSRFRADCRACRAVHRPRAGRCIPSGLDRRGADAVGSGSTDLARPDHGHLCSGKTDGLDT